MTDRAYLRVSVARTAPGQKDTSSGTIKKQRAQLRSKLTEGAVSYVDENVSASKIPFADRPAGGRLLRELQPGDRILVTRIDRAARNVRDLLALVEMVEARGATITFTEQDINTAGAMGKFVLTLLGAIAELESGIISERRIESLAIFKAEGRHAAGLIPTGLRTVAREGGGRKLAVDPEMGPKVAAAMTAILDEGATVASQAPALGITDSSLSRLLRNKLLAEHGVISWTDYDRWMGRNPGRRKTWTKTGGIGEGLRCTCGRRLYFAKPPPSRPHRSALYRCPSKFHTGPTKATSITVTAAEAAIEALYLDKYGHLPEMELRMIGDDDVRAARVGAARTALEAAKARMDNAAEDEEEETYAVWRSAKNDLRLAESMPITTREEFVATGRTNAEAWAEADDAGRVRLLGFPGGPWVVGPPEWAPTRVREDRTDPTPDEIDAIGRGDVAFLSKGFSR